MISLLLSVLCSFAIGVIIHFNEKRQLNRWMVMAANYWTATLLGFFLQGNGQLVFTPLEAGLSVVGGVFFVLGFFLIMHSIHKKGLAIPVTLMRLSVIFPVLFSIIFWNETLENSQIIAFIMTLIAIALFSFRENFARTFQNIRDNLSQIFLLVFVLGLADTLTRSLEYYGVPQKFPSYLMLLFFTAAVITTTVAVRSRSNGVIYAIIMGIVLGLPNYFTSHFILKALEHFPAVFVFPVFNLSVILLSVGFALWVLGERITTTEKIGILVAVPAIILMNL